MGTLFSKRKNKEKDRPLELKIMFLGDGGVGKTTLIIRFLQDRFVDEYDPPIEDIFQKQTILAVDELPILYKIFDSVEEDYLPLGELPQVHSKGFFFVYSITSRHSFEEIEPYIRQTERLKDDTVIKGIGVLIGNKVDLEEDRVVSRKEGEELAKRHQIPFFETSAKTPVNVEEMFQALGSLVISGEAFYQCLAGQNIKAARK